MWLLGNLEGVGGALKSNHELGVLNLVASSM